MNKMNAKVITASLAACVLGCGTAYGQSSDALIDKLVEKGILSVKEANDLREEADKGFSQAYSVKSGMPEWVTSLRFNGDFRGRFEGFYVDNDDFTDRNRWRYRLRFGVTANLFEGFEVGLRLGSGDIDAYPTAGIDPISQNQTLQNNASKKGIFLDLAYAKWTPWNAPSGSATIILGKMENPLTFSDMLMDNDYTPEGLGLQTSFNLSGQHVLRANGGAFILDEIGASTQDPYMLAGQVRLDSSWSKKIASTMGVSALEITSPHMLATNTVPNIGVGNTLTERGAPAYDFHPIVGDAAVTYTLETAPFYPGAFPIRLGGEYMYNYGAPEDADNYGYNLGITFGKAGKKKTWEVSYSYKWLGANAWWEELPDSDFGAYWASPPLYGGKRSADYFSGTNVRGHVVRLGYSPYDFLTLNLKWFHTDVISSRDMTDPEVEGDTATDRLQVDAMLKF